MSDELIIVDKVSKKFCKDLKRSLFYGLKDIVSEFSGHTEYDTLRKDEFWAVKDVSFSLKRGDCLGLVGKNGAGKSTLLKLLTGLVKPDAGKITVRGKVSALIELGTGFNPILTGRENVYINGTILGLGKKEIDKKYDDIVAFAELEDFMETPVQNYSSGMKIRLGFAVAAQLKPDIFIIDEVLAVGDAGFRLKCYNHLAKVLQDTVVIIVSHSMPQIANYCNQAMLLSAGQMQKIGPTDIVIDEYYRQFKEEVSVSSCESGCQLHAFSIHDQHGQKTHSVEYKSTITISFQAQVPSAVERPSVMITFHDRGQQVVAVCETEPGQVQAENGNLNVTVRISPLLFKVDNYKISLLVFDETKRRHLIWYNMAWDLEVTGENRHFSSASIYFEGDWTATGKV